MEPSLILDTISLVTTPGPGVDKAIHASAPAIATSLPPCFPSEFVIWHSSHFLGEVSSKSFLFRWSVPLLSTKVMFPGLAPANISKRANATLAAPAPIIAILTSEIFFPTTLSEFMKPASTTVPVPCWSSCQTGISSWPFNASSISKHLGWAISSRLIPPKVG